MLFVAPSVTDGLADHVPLNTHQNDLALFLLWFLCVREVHVWPPVLDMAIVPLVPEKHAVIKTSIPAVIDGGGVTAVGFVALDPLSDGVDADPNRVMAIWRCLTR